MTKLLQQIDWWRKDGHFNFELYLAFCKAKQEKFEQENEDIQSIF